ncbi:MAG: glutathione peroxidase [Chitinophagaceae bacterium]|nr:glutathione peroxidase [Bacteroidota bacterium]MCC6258825.1 glutathione peroxidase [Chitinophagaceae bacterium]
MRIKQSILKWVYPLIMQASKNSAEKGIQVNSDQIHAPVSLYEIREKDIHGKPFSFNGFRGKKLLIINTASGCGFTAQLGELQKLYSIHKDVLNMVAIPSNDFKNQEMLEAEKIEQFCQMQYGVSFPILQKSNVVKGPNQSCLYQWLSHPEKNGWNRVAPGWNFWKYLVSEEGDLMASFPSGISPRNKILMAMIRNH